MFWKQKRTIPRWMAGVAFLACTMMLAAVLASEVTPRRTWLWLEAGVNGNVMAFDEIYAYDGELTLTAKLPEWKSRWYPMLEINHLGTGEAEVFLDGESIGHLAAWDQKTLGNTIFMLPRDFTGKTLTVEMTKDEGEPIPTLYITDSDIIEENVRAYTAKSALLAAFFGAASLLALGLFFMA